MNESEFYDLKSEDVFFDSLIHRKVYIDIQFFKDIFMGVIFLNINNEDQYKLLLQDVSYNNYRIIENSSFLFPNIGFGNIAFTDYKDNTDNHNAIFKIAPLNMEFVNLFSVYIREVYKALKILDNKNTENITAYINFNVLPGVSKFYQDALLKYVNKKFNINAVSINMPILEFKNKIHMFDSLFIYDLKNFIENPFYRGEFEGLNFLKKMIVSPKMLYSHNNLFDMSSDPVNLKNNPQIISEFNMIEAYLNLICDFKFIDPFKLRG